MLRESGLATQIHWSKERFFRYFFQFVQLYLNFAEESAREEQEN